MHTLFHHTPTTQTLKTNQVPCRKSIAPLWLIECSTSGHVTAGLVTEIEIFQRHSHCWSQPFALLCPLFLVLICARTCTHKQAHPPTHTHIHKCKCVYINIPLKWSWNQIALLKALLICNGMRKLKKSHSNKQHLNWPYWST